MLADEVGVNGEWQLEDKDRGNESGTVEGDARPPAASRTRRDVAQAMAEAGVEEDCHHAQPIDKSPQGEPVTTFEISIGKGPLLRGEKPEPCIRGALDVEGRAGLCLFRNVQTRRKIAHDGTLALRGVDR